MKKALNLRKIGIKPMVAETLDGLTESIVAKCTVLLERVSLLEQELAGARAEIARLTTVVADRSSRLAEAESQNTLLRSANAVGGAIAGSPEDKAYARSLIANLVREINKCIIDLNANPAAPLMDTEEGTEVPEMKQ